MPIRTFIDTIIQGTILGFDADNVLEYVYQIGFILLMILTALGNLAETFGLMLPA